MHVLAGSTPSESFDLSAMRGLRASAKHFAPSTKPAVVPKTHSFTLFVRNKELEQTVSVVLKHKTTSFQAIIDQLIARKLRSDPRWRSLLRVPYFLVFDRYQDQQHILCLELSASDYNIPNHAVLILTTSNPKVHEVGPQDLAVAATFDVAMDAEGKRERPQLVISCSFGAPYTRTNVISSYFGSCSLNQYAQRLREKFHISPKKTITFTFNRTTCLGLNRKCGIRELGIRPNDEILAETNGINLTLRPFGAPNRVKVIEMFENFTLKMLRKQIQVELGIAIGRQKALILRGWKLIDNDSKCRKIREYETITVLTACGCSEGRNRCPAADTLYAAKPQNPLAVAAPPIKSGVAPLAASTATAAVAAVPPLPQDAQCPPIAHFAYSPYGDVLYQRQMAAIRESTRRLKELEVLHLMKSRLAHSRFLRGGLKVCHYGDHCKFYNNPHVLGPCRYYHPPGPYMEW